MEGVTPGHRYAMINIEPGYIIVEHEVHSREMRSYFSAEPEPPVEEYREGPRTWQFSGMAQSFHFDLRDTQTREVTRFDDLLGLIPYTACASDSDIYRLGELAQEQRVWLYVAVTHTILDPSRFGPWLEKLKILNRYFAERVATPNKKVLILPDYFGLHRQFNHGQILADTGLTAMEA